jgi:hypothetical protein
MQGAHRFRGVARPPPSKMEPIPILDQNPQRQPVAGAPRPLGLRRLFTHCRRIQSLRHVAHDGGGGFACLRQRKREARSQRHAPFLAVHCVLGEISPAAARGNTHGEAALRVIEDQPVLGTVLDCKRLDFPLCQLHSRPRFYLGPLRVRSGSADPQRTPPDDVSRRLVTT